MAHWPVPSLTDPGLTFRPGPPIQWVRILEQDGSVVTAGHQAAPLPQKRRNEAIVEVCEIALPERPREQAVLANLDTLKRRLALAMRTPPPRHGEVELADLMLADPAQPQVLELAKVRSLHLRFNRMPPARTVPR